MLKGCDIDSVLPGRDQGDAEVQLRGAAAEDGGDEPPRHTDADAHEALQSTKKLLYCWVLKLNHYYSLWLGGVQTIFTFFREVQTSWAVEKCPRWNF